MAPPKKDVNPRTNPKAAGPPAPKKKPTENIFGTPPTPPAPKGKGSAWQQFVDYWAAHGFKNLKVNAQSIYLAAKAEHIDPVTFGALILNESGGDFNTADSSAGAIGIGQLLPSSFLGRPLPWNTKHTITLADLHDRGINLRLSAYYFGQMQGRHPDAPYGAYNAGPNADQATITSIQKAWYDKWITKWNPKYTPTGTTSPAGPAGTQVPGGTGLPAPDNTFHDPYVTGVNKQGKFTTTRDPNKAMQYDGAPLTRSAFLTLGDQLTSHYVSYTGNRPTKQQIVNYVTKGWNPYTLDVLLSKSKNFAKSPIYKQYAGNMNAAVKDLLPKGGKIPTELLRQAVVNQWDATTVAQKLRAQGTYTNSNEFKGNVASLLNVHSSIMGTPDPKAMVTIKDAALQGWTSDQYAAYLRSQPAYQESPEYQTKSLTMLSALGLLTGGQAVLAKGITPGPGSVQPKTQTLSADKRVPGNPNNLSDPLDLGATLH